MNNKFNSIFRFCAAIDATALSFGVYAATGYATLNGGTTGGAGGQTVWPQGVLKFMRQFVLEQMIIRLSLFMLKALLLQAIPKKRAVVVIQPMVLLN
jgi:hypothetical protein